MAQPGRYSRNPDGCGTFFAHLPCRPLRSLRVNAMASPDAVLHLAALHALARAGFASASRAASLTLSAVLARYLAVLARSCTERAALAGRSKVAAVDVVDTLDALGLDGVGQVLEWTAGREEEVLVGARMDELAGRSAGLLPRVSGLKFKPFCRTG